MTLLILYPAATRTRQITITAFHAYITPHDFGTALKFNGSSDKVDFTECLDLRGRLAAALLPKQHIVVAIGVERRIKVNEVYALVRNVPLEYFEIIPEVERIHADTIQQPMAQILR